jgi:hypothetical protein
MWKKKCKKNMFIRTNERFFLQYIFWQHGAPNHLVTGIWKLNTCKSQQNWNTYECTYTYVYAHAHVHVLICNCAYICIYVYVRIYMYIRIFFHMYLLHLQIQRHMYI